MPSAEAVQRLKSELISFGEQPGMTQADKARVGQMLGILWKIQSKDRARLKNGECGKKH